MGVRTYVSIIRSSPTRGMWIEMTQNHGYPFGMLSSPTRGMWIEIAEVTVVRALRTGHPPHGGCGLKLQHLIRHRRHPRVIPHTGDVD